MEDEVVVKNFDEDTYPLTTEEIRSNEGKSPFSQVSRVITEEDLKSPVVVRILLNQFDEYQNLKSKYEHLQLDFHKKDKVCAILEEREKGNKAVDILNTVMLSVGPLLLGMLTYLIKENGWDAVTIIVCIAGGVLLLGGILTKFFVKG